MDKEEFETLNKEKGLTINADGFEFEDEFSGIKVIAKEKISDKSIIVKSQESFLTDIKTDEEKSSPKADSRRNQDDPPSLVKPFFSCFLHKSTSIY